MREEKIIIISIFFLFHSYLLFTLEGIDILNNVDKNLDYNTLSIKAKMKIYDGNNLREKEILILSDVKKNNAIAEFLNPEDEGIKYLKLDKELWIYFPSEEDTVKISGHMLKQGMMGSDISYEDALEYNTLSEKYDITVVDDDKIGNSECYVLNLTAIVKNASYAKRIMWIDKSTFVVWKEELFAKSGKMLKSITALEVSKIENYYFVIKSETRNMVKEGNKTILEIIDIKINPKFEKNIFTKRYLYR